MELSQLGQYTPMWNYCTESTELPASVGQLTSMCKLKLCNFHELRTLPATFMALTGLQELTISHCALIVMPRCIEYLTLLQKLVFDPGNVIRDAEEAFQVLACVLPSLQQLRHLHISTVKTWRVYPQLRHGECE
jgi:hypothetical protein